MAEVQLVKLAFLHTQLSIFSLSLCNIGETIDGSVPEAPSIILNLAQGVYVPYLWPTTNQTNKLLMGIHTLNLRR